MKKLPFPSHPPLSFSLSIYLYYSSLLFISLPDSLWHLKMDHSIPLLPVQLFSLSTSISNTAIYPFLRLCLPCFIKPYNKKVVFVFSISQSQAKSEVIIIYLQIPRSL